MDLILAPQERLIKEWNYATEKTTSDKEDHYLAVTNKRVVFGTNKKQGFSREEILIEYIQRISTSYEKGINLGYLAMCIIGFLVLCAGIIIGMVYVPNIYIVIGGSVVGAIFIVSGISAILASRHAQFSVVLYTAACDDVGIEANTILHKEFVHKKTTKISVNADVAREIVDTIGAIIVAK